MSNKHFFFIDIFLLIDKQKHWN